MAKKQLGLWGLDYFDLFLVHFPISLQYVDPAERYPPEWWDASKKVVTLGNTPLNETWKEMEALVDDGLAKNIGVSNSQGSVIVDMMTYARIKPQVLQVELHPFLSQDNLVKFAKTLGIAITAYSSFGPQSYFELGASGQSLFTHNVVVDLAKKHNKTPAQVLLRWATQREIAVIPKSNSGDRLRENFDCMSFDLKPEEIKALSDLNCNIRMNDPAEIDPRLAIFA